MTKSVVPYLMYIIETLDSIRTNTPKDHDVFMQDANSQDATLMRLQDIGENLIKIRDQYPEFYQENYNEIWPKIIGLRNIISHGYRSVDFEIIWDILTDKLGGFEVHMRAIAKNT